MRAGSRIRGELRFRNPDSFPSIDNPPEEFEPGGEAAHLWFAANDRRLRAAVRAEIQTLNLAVALTMHRPDKQDRLLEIQALARQQLAEDNRIRVGTERVALSVDIGFDPRGRLPESQYAMESTWRPIYPHPTHDQRMLSLAMEVHIDKLTPTQQEALRAVFWEGLSERDAAKSLEIGRWPMRERLQRALANLRRDIYADMKGPTNDLDTPGPRT